MVSSGDGQYRVKAIWVRQFLFYMKFHLLNPDWASAYSLHIAKQRPKAVRAYYSVLRFLTGLLTAAFTAWKLTVMKAIANAKTAATRNTHQVISTR
jgi:hypothetical protein